ncbi:MAG: glycosyltransferase family 2 protein [Ruminococcaceae bacterium]|nr:glycosyltransferase family 2 protein [Oscillospiraceae bacterium]
MSQKISFVVPCYNEAESLQMLYDGIVANTPGDLEILFINDGSTDDTANVIRRLHEADGRVHLVSFRKNLGKSAALQAGFRNCTGDIVITMDADLQDDPTEIVHFIAALEEGYDVVSGWKFKRNDPLEKRLPSKLFNRVVARLSGVKLHDFNCGFKAYRREAVEAIDLYGELHRYIPVLAYRKGFRITEIKVHHNERKFGKSKYGFERYLRGFFDALTVAFISKFYDRPMHLFGRLGLLVTLIGLVLCIILTVQWFMGMPIGTRPLLMLGVLCIIVGIQFFITGFLGDMIVESTFRSRYDESHIKEKF